MRLLFHALAWTFGLLAMLLPAAGLGLLVWTFFSDASSLAYFGAFLLFVILGFAGMFAGSIAATFLEKARRAA